MIYDIVTLGCKVNEYESRYYAEQLESLGLENAQNHPGKPADVVVINTCTVTNTAARKSRQKIRRARKENPEAVCVVIGCYAQTMEEQTRKELEADLLIGASSKSRLKALVKEELEHRHQISLVQDIDEICDFEAMPIGTFEGQHRAFLKIQDGCNQYCAYCQIPLARGPERSLIPQDVVSIARKLAEQGHKEIVLTGIHTGRYHFRHDNLVSLLKMLLEEVDENVDFRLSSIEITEVSDELIELMQSNPRLLPHLHIPIQAGCDQTLQRMKRPYTMKYFKKRIAEIREKIPEISISTDVIAGFVGETEQEFQTTRDNLEALQFSFLHVFPYSRRAGTAADAMSGFVDPAVAKARTDELLALSAKLRHKDMERFDEVEVLVERPGNEPDTFSGYTRQYQPVLIESKVPLQGRIKAKVSGIEKGVLRARVLEE